MSSSPVDVNSRKFAVPAANEFTRVTPFTILIISILFVWILIDLFTRFVFNVSYNTLGLDSSSAIHSLLVLVLITVFLVATVWVIDSYGLVEGGLVSSVTGLASPVLSPGQSASTGSKPGSVPGTETRNGTFVSEAAK